MKKKLMPIFALLLALTMVLTACDSIPGRGDDDDDRRGSNSENDDRQDRDDDNDRRDDDDTQSGGNQGGGLFGGLFGGGSDSSGNSSSSQAPGSSGSGNDDGMDYEGNLGDEMTTAFFKFTVEDAQCYSGLNGHTPRSGYKYLVLDLTITNLQRSSLTMFDADFWLMWGPDDGEDDFPVTELIDENQLPEEYKIPIAGTRSGTLVFEVPAELDDFILNYLEIYADDSVGDSFWIYFTAGDVRSDPNPSTSSDPSAGSDPSSGGDDGTVGRVGDTLSTAFFDFSVNGAYFFPSIGTASPGTGKVYLVLDMTIKNTMNSELPMYYDDFPLLYGAEYDTIIDPITETIDADQLPNEYDIAVGQSRTGYLVYEVPQSEKNFYLGFQEFFSGGTKGEIYLIYIDSADITSVAS